MNPINVDVRKLGNLNLFQLREVGAQIGVKNPTTLRANKLREAIKDVVEGRTQPYLKIKSGRPHAKKIIPDEDWDRLVGFDDGLNQDFGANNNISGALFALRSSRLAESDQTEYSGFVKNVGERWVFFPEVQQFCSIDKYAIIPDTFDFLDSLRVGDKITCKLEFEKDGPKVSNVLAINGQKIDNKTELGGVFSEMTPKALGDVIEFSLPQLDFLNKVCPIRLGQRVLVKGPNASGQTYLASSIAKDLESRYAVVYFAVAKRPEDKITLNSCEYLFTAFDVEPRDISFLYEIALERAKRLCELGKNVVFIIDDITSLMLNIRNLITEKDKSEKEHSVEIIKQLKRMLGNSKFTDNGSLTIISTAYTDSFLPQFNENLDEIDNIVNCHINLIKEDYRTGKAEFYDKNNTYADIVREI